MTVHCVNGKIFMYLNSRLYKFKGLQSRWREAQVAHTVVCNVLVNAEKRELAILNWLDSFQARQILYSILPELFKILPWPSGNNVPMLNSSERDDIILYLFLEVTAVFAYHDTSMPWSRYAASNEQGTGGTILSLYRTAMHLVARTELRKSITCP